MPIGKRVDWSWVEGENQAVKDLVEFRPGWYHVIINEVLDKAPSKTGLVLCTPLRLRILTEAGGWGNEVIWHRFCEPAPEAIEDKTYTGGVLRMWRNDQRAFLRVAFPDGYDLEAIDLDAVEGMEVYARMQLGKEYEGRRSPEVVGGSWTADLPDGVVEGPR